MSASTVNSDASDDDLATQRPSVYKYDLRLEIGAKNDGSTIQVATIFYELVRRLKDAADDDAPVAVLTATDKLFHENKDMTSDEFQKAFMVDNFNGKSAKVLLGFKIHSMTKLSELKRRLMHTYLIPHNLFLRLHMGGFQNGVKSFNYGFLQNDHPDHPDIAMLKQRFARLISESWKKLDAEDKKKWRHDLPNSFFGSTGILLPINFTKERLSATNDGKEKIITNALMVSTPIKYGKLMKILLDKAITAKRLNNLIPYALSRSNPTGYYYLVANQARFIENHRNIPIMNVPVDAEKQTGVKGRSLLDILNGHTFVQRVAYDPHENKYHVSTIATKYREAHQWIANALEEHAFPYKPSMRPMKYGGGGGAVNSADSYSDIFKDAISLASEKYTANSTTQPNPGNAWKNRPPLAISYSLTTDSFPPLTSTAKPHVAATTSTASETFDEETIQSAISVAIKKLEDQHKHDLAQMKRDMQVQIDELRFQMQDLGQQVATQTYQALVKEESPLVTKTDHAQLQHEMTCISTQLTTLIGMLQPNLPALQSFPISNLHQHQHPTMDITPMNLDRKLLKRKPSSTPEKPPRQHEPSTQDCSISSASSDSEQSMEGCES